MGTRVLEELEDSQDSEVAIEADQAQDFQDFEAAMQGDSTNFQLQERSELLKYIFNCT